MSTKERPILFSGAMVRAILEGRKVQTRRVMKRQPRGSHWESFPEYRLEKRLEVTENNTGVHTAVLFIHRIHGGFDCLNWIPCPYGKPGDRLWVRETWTPQDGMTLEACEQDTVIYRADGEVKKGEYPYWRPSIHMPRWASRITLEITGIRVERVQEISDHDCACEGIRTSRGSGLIEGDICFHFPTGNGYSRIGWHAFKALWDSINAERGYGWDKNPFVWVIEFKRVE